MPEDTNESAPEQESVVQEAQEHQSQPQATEPKAEKDVDRNWREANRVLGEQKQKIAELEARMTQQQAKPAEEEKDEFADMDPDDYLKVGTAIKMAEKLSEKKATAAAKKLVGEYAYSQKVASDEANMRSTHDDYDYVIDNFAMPLIKNDPVLAHKLMTSKNPALTAYKLGKMSDAFEEQSVEQMVSPKAAKIMKNAARPTSGNALGQPLKSQADALSKMSPQQVWEQSQKYARSV